MGLWNKIIKFINKRREVLVMDDDDDPLMKEVVKRCWETEKGIIGTRDEKGNIEIKEFDIDKS